MSLWPKPVDENVIVIFALHNDFKNYRIKLRTDIDSLLYFFIIIRFLFHCLEVLIAC